MIIVGLTGSIGMGKSTTSNILRDEGFSIYDADEEVALLYAVGGGAVSILEASHPEVVVDGAVDRLRLSALIMRQPEVLSYLETTLHPLLKVRREAFLEEHRAAGTKLVVLDVPLLLEVAMDLEVDVVVVVSASPELQKRRCLARPGMTVEKLNLILSRQLSDQQKRNRAHFVILTDEGIEDARKQVREMLEKVFEAFSNREDI